MRKKILTAGMTALMLTAASAPLSAQAANVHTINWNGLQGNVIIWNGNCESLGDFKLPGCGLGDIVIPEWNRPSIPEIEKPETEKPETEKPETPEIEIPDTQNKSFAQQVVDLVNRERAKEGLAPLTMDETLNQAALVRAKEIQTSFSHTRPNGSGFATAIKEAGAAYRTAGENIAWGQDSPEEVVEAWMNSAGHRKNIMNASFTRIGVGHLQNGAGTDYWAQLFTN